MAEYYVEHLRLVEGKEQVKSYIWYPGPNSNVENKCPDVNGEIQASEQALDYCLNTYCVY